MAGWDAWSLCSQPWNWNVLAVRSAKCCNAENFEGSYSTWLVSINPDSCFVRQNEIKMIARELQSYF